MRYLTPSEIELWELARKAMRQTCERCGHAADGVRGMCYSWPDEAPEICGCLDDSHDPTRPVAVPPSTISSLLETLEKTRRELLNAQTLVDEWEKHDDENAGFVCARPDLRRASHEWMDRSGALLAGFKEESSD